MTIAIGKAEEHTRRIWSELVPYPMLCSAPVLHLLRERNLQVLLGVTPSQMGGLEVLIKTYQDAGIKLGLWPMVDDSDGRWGSTFNAGLFSEFVLQVSAFARQATTIAIDLEPPIAIVHGLLRGDASAYRKLAAAKTWEPGTEILRALISTLQNRGHRCVAAVSPVLLGDARGQSAWQWLLGTPIDALPFDAISFMAYTSLLEGYSRGLVNRRVATSLLAQTAMRSTKQWGHRASVSVGSVGVGALGDERPYRNVAELEEDVAVAMACGAHDLALFDLSGVLAKSDPAAWLDAFVNTTSAAGAPRIAKRARLLGAVIKNTGSTIGWYRRTANRW